MNFRLNNSERFGISVGCERVRSVPFAICSYKLLLSSGMPISSLVFLESQTLSSQQEEQQLASSNRRATRITLDSLC